MPVFIPCARQRALACTLILSACSCTAAAQDSLEEVVVSAAKGSSSLRQTPAAISKIDRGTLAEKKPNFVGQVLNQAAGVYVTDLGNEQHNMSIRQPLSYNALYLYMEDGIPIRPTGLFNHNALYEINLASTGDIEVMRGPAAALYGSNAAGGAVNFITRAPSAKNEGLVGVQSTNQGYRRVDYEASGPVGEGGLRLSGYQSTRHGGWQRYNNADKDSLSLRHDTAVGDAALLKTVLSYNRLWTEMPGSLNEDDYHNRPGFSYQNFTWRKVESTRLSSQLEGSWNADGLSSLTLYARNNSTDQLPSYLIFNTGATSAMGRTTAQHFRSLGLDAHHRQNWGERASLLFGLSWEDSPMQAQERNLAIVRDPADGSYTSFSPGTMRRDYQVDIRSQALYAQADWRLAPNWKLQAGGRYDAVRYAYRNALTPSASTGAPSQTRRYQHFSPKLGLSWALAPNWSWWGNLSQGFTPPEVSAQYGGSLVAPNLRPSVYDNADTGLRWQQPDQSASAELSLYRLQGRDEVVNYSISPGQSEARNAGKTRHQGLEFALRWAPKAQAWDAKLAGALASHRYQHYQVSPSLQFDGKAMPAAPRAMANVELGYKPNAQWRLSAEVQHLGSYWMDNANRLPYPGHSLLHLRASYRQGQWEAWGSLQNASNRHYAEIASSSYTGVGAYQPNAQNSYAPGQPRTLLLGLRYHFGEQP